MPRVTRADFASLRQKVQSRKAKREYKAEQLRRGRPKFPSLGNVKKWLDNLCSLVVRQRDSAKTAGRCVFGCGRPIECAFHFIRKSRSLKMRYDLRNVVASCFICNGYMEHNEGPFWTWYARNMGVDQMEAIQRESHGRADFSRGDFEAMGAAFKATLESPRWPLTRSPSA